MSSKNLIIDVVSIECIFLSNLIRFEIISDSPNISLIDCVAVFRNLEIVARRKTLYIYDISIAYTQLPFGPKCDCK